MKPQFIRASLPPIDWQEYFQHSATGSLWLFLESQMKDPTNRATFKCFIKYKKKTNLDEILFWLQISVFISNFTQRGIDTFQNNILRFKYIFLWTTYIKNNFRITVKMKLYWAKFVTLLSSGYHICTMTIQ